MQRTCVKCPREIAATANEGLDGILVELPAPLACRTNLPFTANLYRIETLFGTNSPFILPEGRHRIMGRIRNVESGLIVRTCQLRYTVAVRRCKGLPKLKSKQLRISCTAGALWGSKCAFKCRDERLFLSHRDPIVCNDDLQWQGHKPECVDYDTYGKIVEHLADFSLLFKSRLNFNLIFLVCFVRLLLHVEEMLTNDQSNSIEEAYCSRPEEPANGHYACGTSGSAQDTSDSHLLDSGSVCQVKCDRSYSIPLHLYQMSTIECQNGNWNVTGIEVCYKEQPMRRLALRRHHKRGKFKRTVEQPTKD